MSTPTPLPTLTHLSLAQASSITDPIIQEKILKKSIQQYLDSGAVLPAILKLISLYQLNPESVGEIILPLLASSAGNEHLSFRGANLNPLIKGISGETILKYAPGFSFFSNLRLGLGLESGHESNLYISKCQEIVQQTHKRVFGFNDNDDNHDHNNNPKDSIQNVNVPPNVLLLASNGFLSNTDNKGSSSMAFNYSLIVLFIQFLDFFIKHEIYPSKYFKGQTQCDNLENLENLCTLYTNNQISQSLFLTHLSRLFQVETPFFKESQSNNSLVIDMLCAIFPILDPIFNSASISASTLEAEPDESTIPDSNCKCIMCDNITFHQTLSSRQHFSETKRPSQAQTHSHISSPLHCVTNTKSILTTLVTQSNEHSKYLLPLNCDHWDPIVFNKITVSHLFCQFASYFHPTSIPLFALSSNDTRSPDQSNYPNNTPYIELAQSLPLLLFEYCFTFSLAPYVNPQAETSAFTCLKHQHSFELKAYFSHSDYLSSSNARKTIYHFTQCKLCKTRNQGFTSTTGTGSLSDFERDSQLLKALPIMLTPGQSQSQGRPANTNTNNSYFNPIRSNDLFPYNTPYHQDIIPKFNMFQQLVASIHPLISKYKMNPGSILLFSDIETRIKYLLQLSLCHVLALQSLTMLFKTHSTFFLSIPIVILSPSFLSWISIAAGSSSLPFLSLKLFPSMLMALNERYFDSTDLQPHLVQVVPFDIASLINPKLPTNTNTESQSQFQIPQYFQESSFYDDLLRISRRGAILGSPDSVYSLGLFNSQIVSQLPPEDTSVQNSSELVEHLSITLFSSLYDTLQFQYFLSTLETLELKNSNPDFGRISLSTITCGSETGSQSDIFPLLHFYNAVICRNSASIVYFALIANSHKVYDDVSFPLFSILFSQLPNSFDHFITKYPKSLTHSRIESFLSVLFELFTPKAIKSLGTILPNDRSTGTALQSMQNQCHPLFTFYNIINGSTQFRSASNHNRPSSVSGLNQLNYHDIDVGDSPKSSKRTQYQGFTPKFNFAPQKKSWSKAYFDSLQQQIPMSSLSFPLFLTILYSHINDNYSILLGLWHLQIVDSLHSILSLQSRKHIDPLELSIHQVLSLTHYKQVSPLLSNKSSLLQAWKIHHELAFMHLTIPFIHKKNKSSLKVFPSYVSDYIMDLLSMDKFAFFANDIFNISKNRSQPIQQYHPKLDLKSSIALKPTKYSIQDAFLVNHNYLFNIDFREATNFTNTFRPFFHVDQGGDNACDFGSSCSSPNTTSTTLVNISVSQMVTFSWAVVHNMFKSIISSTQYSGIGSTLYGSNHFKTNNVLVQKSVLPFLPNKDTSFISPGRTLLCCFTHKSIFHDAINNYFTSDSQSVSITASSSSSVSTTNVSSSDLLSEPVLLPVSSAGPSSMTTPSTSTISTTGIATASPVLSSFNTKVAPKPFGEKNIYFDRFAPDNMWKTLPSFTKMYFNPIFHTLASENTWILKLVGGDENAAILMLIQSFRLGQMDHSHRALLGSFIFHKFFSITQDVSALLLVNTRFFVRMGYLHEIISNLLTVSRVLIPIFENSSFSNMLKETPSPWLHYFGLDFESDDDVRYPSSPSTSTNSSFNDSPISSYSFSQKKDMARYLILTYAYYCRLVYCASQFPPQLRGLERGGIREQDCQNFMTIISPLFFCDNPVSDIYPHLSEDLQSLFFNEFERVANVATQFQMMPKIQRTSLGPSASYSILLRNLGISLLVKRYPKSSHNPFGYKRKLIVQRPDTPWNISSPKALSLACLFIFAIAPSFLFLKYLWYWEPFKS